MPKIIAPPAISNIDGLIDLLTNPQKYLDYMKQIREMRDNILGLLEGFDTKEKADEYLARAQDTVNDINTAREKSAAEVKRVEQVCKEKCAEAESLVAKAKENAVTIERGLRDREQALVAQTAELIAREKQATMREGALVDREKRVASRETELAAELAKLKKTKELLAGIS